MRAPDAFLSSGEDLAWAEPRAAWVRRRAPAPHGGAGEWLVLEIDPPVPGRRGQVDVIVAVPRHADELPGDAEPVHVHLLVPRDPAAIDGSTIDAEQLDHVAWGALYATEQEARERYESLREADEATRGGVGTPLARTENALEEALLAARRRGDVEPMLPVLADADVYLPTPEGVETLAREVPLPLVEAGGDPFVPVFSSLAALARYRPEGGGYLRLSGRALAEVVPGEYPVIVDPGSELAVPLRRGDLARLRDVPPQEGHADLLIGEPREEPVEAIAAIRRFAAARPEVRAAYRALLVLRPGTEAEPVIGLELDPGADGELVVRDAAEAARAAGVESLAIVPFEPGAAETPVSRFLRGRTEAFYTREG